MCMCVCVEYFVCFVQVLLVGLCVYVCVCVQVNLVFCILQIYTVIALYSTFCQTIKKWNFYKFYTFMFFNVTIRTSRYSTNLGRIYSNMLLCQTLDRKKHKQSKLITGEPLFKNCPIKGLIILYWVEKMTKHSGYHVSTLNKQPIL